MPTLHNSASRSHAVGRARRKWRRALVGIVISGLPACGSDGFGPVPAQFDGTYALQSVNGARVPATAAEGGGQRYVLLADTLRFSRDGIVARSLVYRHFSSTFVPRDTVYQYRMTLPYTVTGERLTIGYVQPCPPNANCVGFEEGTITTSRATVLGRLYWPGEPVLRFHRLSNP